MGAKHFGARVTRLEDPGAAVRARPLRRRREAARHAARLLRALAACARHTRVDRQPRRRWPCRAFTRSSPPTTCPSRCARSRMPMLLPNPALTAARTQHALARDEVCYVGQPVAVVIADTRYIAEDAAAALVVDYDVLPAVARLPRRRSRTARRARTAISPSNVASHVSAWPMATSTPPSPTPRMSSRGASGSTAAAAWRSKRRAVLASHDAGVGSAHRLVGNADAASWPQHAGRSARPRRAINPHDRARRRRRLRPEGDLLSGRGGDPGGGAEARPAGEMDRGPARAFSVRDAGARPILGRGDRGRRRGEDSRRARPHAPRHRRLSCRGASSCPISPRRPCRGPYVVPAYQLDTIVVLTNKVPTTPVRGAGRPQAVFAMERLLDRVARELEHRPRRGAPPQFHHSRSRCPMRSA